MYTGNTYDLQTKGMLTSVYPCVYREHNENFFIISIPRGLSLCIQGTLDNRAYSNSADRFIPVYTGNTTKIIDYFLINAVYPCVYREHIKSDNQRNNYVGLSLCIQGTRSYWREIVLIWRFIPVYTGNTLIITYCFIIKILTVKFLPIFWDIFIKITFYNTMFLFN